MSSPLQSMNSKISTSPSAWEGSWFTKFKFVSPPTMLKINILKKEKGA